jgi:hypothetical protein
VSDEQPTPPFDLADLAIEGWEVTARFCDDSGGGWEVAWRRNAHNLTYYFQARAWDCMRPERQSEVIRRVVESAKARMDYRDQHGQWPDD